MIYTILDLDNCISDDRHRRCWLEDYSIKRTQRLEEYHARCEMDKFDWDVDLYGMVPDTNIIIFTGRPRMYQEETLGWLFDNGIFTDYLFMRPEYNKMSNIDLKEMYLYELKNYQKIEGKDIKMAYDDIPLVIDMYRKNGIPATLKQINYYA